MRDDKHHRLEAVTVEEAAEQVPQCYYLKSIVNNGNVSGITSLPKCMTMLDLASMPPLDGFFISI
jgi:hypothetical protein